jgi:hypothetical protein
MPRGSIASTAVLSVVCKVDIEGYVSVLWTTLKYCNGLLRVGRPTLAKPCFSGFRPISSFNSWEMAAVIERFQIFWRPAAAVLAFKAFALLF